jgi:excisionase family DNA binding protein
MSHTAPSIPRLLTVAEVAERLRVDPRTVQRKTRSGLLPAFELGGPRPVFRVDERKLLF